MDRAERIEKMEKHLDLSRSAVQKLSAALDEWEAAKASLRALAAYYESPLWREDFEADEAGELPPDLKRGVLSEDAAYDLLEEARIVEARLKEAGLRAAEEKGADQT